MTLFTVLSSSPLIKKKASKMTILINVSYCLQEKPKLPNMTFKIFYI